MSASITPSHTAVPADERAAYEARLRHVVEKFNTLNNKEMASVFTEDVVVHYNNLPEVQGMMGLRGFLRFCYADVTDYTLTKVLRMVDGSTVGVEVRALYRSKADGKRYLALAYEFLEFEGDLIRVWDYVGNNHEIAEQDPA